MWEYLQGSNPAVADVDAGSSIKSGVASFQGADYLVASYPRQENLPPGVIVKLQCSHDLNDWSAEFVVEGATPSAGIAVSIGAATNGTRTVSVRQNLPFDDPGMYPFMRFLVEQAP